MKLTRLGGVNFIKSRLALSVASLGPLMSDRDMAQMAFREGMSRLGAAVCLITTDGPAGRSGMTATAVCSVTDTPPTLLVCINQVTRSHDMFIENGVLCVNVLAGGHDELASRFARANEEDRFATTTWETGLTGAPILPDALTIFECRIVDKIVRGTHSIFICEVVSTLTGADKPGLVWFGRRYLAMPPPMPGQP